LYMPLSPDLHSDVTHLDLDSIGVSICQTDYPPKYHVCNE
jgi:hypothetical protein